MSKKKNERGKIQKGSKFGKYQLVDMLGSGGNGDVWKVSDDEHNYYAMKILKNLDTISYQRFKAEVNILSTLDIDGVMKIIEFSLPENIKCEFPWFVMDVAEEFDFFKNRGDAIKIASEFIPLANTLEELHGQDIAHRDIKPSNILFYKNRLFFTDFGLVKYPKRENITPKRRDVGAKFTMAPEMRRYADTADGKKADVYSFAKTLWIAITGEERGFDGQYIPDGILGLKNYHKHLYLKSLDNLLIKATDNNPNNRPKIDEFSTELIEWIKLNKDFESRNLREWFEIQSTLFPLGVPSQVSWTDPDTIVSIFRELSKSRSLNHMFFPDGGGHTVIGASLAAESGFIALNVGEKMTELVKPKKLTYETFGRDPEWDYFRLELAEVEPLDIEDCYRSRDIAQEITEVSPGVYIGISSWEDGECQGNPLPESARRAKRFLKGSFVIFSTRSIYNRLTGKYDAYDARHNDMSEDEFRDHIQQLYKSYMVAIESD